MVSEFDVAVVGAGPAGSWAAYRLAQRGARVALIDGSHPREKPCGGGVTGRALEFIGDAIDPALVGAVDIESVTFIDGPYIARMPLACGEPGARHLAVVARKDFDGALRDAARRAGAACIEARATDVQRRNGGWTIATRGGSANAGWIVGADGPNSLVRRRVSRAFERAALSIAAGYFVHGTSSREIVVEFEHDPPGYLWSFPRRDHLAVGVGSQADISTSTGLLAIASSWIAKHVTQQNLRLERYSWPIPSLDERGLEQERPSGDRWMLAGDAGGFVDPITREGIFFALASGEAAAASLAAADPASDYHERIRDEIYPELMRAARLKARFFNRPFTSLLVRAIKRSPRIQTVVTDLVAGRQPYRTLRARLLATLEVKLMLELFGVPFAH